MSISGLLRLCPFVGVTPPADKRKHQDKHKKGDKQMFFKMVPTDKHFEDNIRALSEVNRSVRPEKRIFNISMWIKDTHAVDCDYVRLLPDGVIGYSVKGQMGERRDKIEDVINIQFWVKR
jgi:hypothetical protein